MKKIKLGRRGIKLRNNFILLIILIIFFSIFSIISNKKEENKVQYAIQTQQLVQAKNNILKNTEGVTYYISENGTSTEGTDINNPMSLKTANTKTYNGNDKILFKAGDIFYGTINFNIQTEENEYVYIGSYGEGEKPIISGANILKNAKAWILEDGLYKIDLSNYDNFEGIGKTSWEPYNIGFIADENGNIYGNRKQTKDEIEKEFDFYCENNYLYLKCSKNPTEKLGKIKFVSRNNLVNLSSNTIIENMDIQYTGAHGIVKKNDEIKNVYVKNCIIQNIGGSVQIASTFTRYGNGLEFWNSASNTIVEGCIFRNTYDAGYTMQGNTVTTGFENNICQDSIFINCTYTYETFCRNKNNSSIEKDIYLKEQKFINNISINQGRGWGYEVRPDKDPAAEFVLWTIPIQNSNIEMYGNVLFNSRRLKYNTIYREISAEDYKKCIKSDNNKLYLANDTYLINNKGSYQEKGVLEEYGIEKNSEVYLLTELGLNKINNQNILKSNDYDQIKTYYEDLEKELPYLDYKMSIQEKYNQFKQQNQTVIKTTGISTQINQLETYLQQLNTTNLTKEGLTTQIQQNYQLGTTILEEYLNNKLNLSEGELVEILQQINEIGKLYNTLYSLLPTQETIDLTDINNQIIEAEKVIKQYQPINLLQESTLIDNCKTIMQSGLRDTIKNIATTYILNWTQELLDVDIIKYATKNPPTLEYSTKNITNQNVIVALVSNYYIEITNNDSEAYTFTKNGSFVFNYTIRGRKFTIEAKVNNIDKTSPVITGIEEAKTYLTTNKVKPQITDENLKEVKLLLNGQVVNNYVANSVIQEEGIYQLIATDKAGNETVVRFQIREPKDEDYKIEDKQIRNIDGSTKKTDFQKKLLLNEEYSILRNNKEIADDENIATGDVLKTKSGKEYNLIVTGDINKDGEVTIKDILRIRRYLLGNVQLGDIEKIAADANLDGKEIGIRDLVRIRILALTRKY